jgi:hypothetical protein
MPYPTFASLPPLNLEPDGSLPPATGPKPVIFFGSNKGKTYLSDSMHLLVIGPDALDILHTVLHRALNTWENAPEELVRMSDELLRIHPQAKILPSN